MRIWAIGDLHLGFSTGKGMERFGEHWRDHHVKVETAWRERIEPGDLVLLPGDFSWAMKPAQVKTELEWLARLPGTKVLIKGNHDYWWPGSRKKLAELLPPDVHCIKKNALVISGVPLIGVRGADFVPYHGRTQEQVDAALERELRELRLSIEDLAAQGPPRRPPIALFHYPPFPAGERESGFTRLIREAGCRRAVYGHLHTEEDWRAFFRGEAAGVTYHLVSCDFLGFVPILLEEV